MRKTIQVALDGPGGAGKSTLARAVAAACGLHYVDTGAMYRAVALGVARSGVNVGDKAAVAAVLPTLSVTLDYDGEGKQHTLLNKEDVSGLIRTPEVTAAASAVSALPEVRAFLLRAQQTMAEEWDVVMDGRDIGTVVLPNADLKVFLTASPEARAKRRWLELRAKGMEQPYEQVLSEMNARDTQDSTRAAAPLRQAEDAILLDTTELNEQEAIEALRRLIRERTGR